MQDLPNVIERQLIQLFIKKALSVFFNSFIFKFLHFQLDFLYLCRPKNISLKSRYGKFC